MIRESLWAYALLFVFQINEDADLPTSPIYTLKPPNPTDGSPFTSASPLIVKRTIAGTGTINLFSIAYAFRPRLRARLTLRRLTLLKETLDFRWQDFSSCLSLLMPTSAFPYAPAWLTSHLRCRWNAPLPLYLHKVHCFGTRFSPEYYRRWVAWLVSYYALFKWMAASKPTS